MIIIYAVNNLGISLSLLISLILKRIEECHNDIYHACLQSFSPQCQYICIQIVMYREISKIRIIYLKVKPMSLKAIKL